MRSATTKAKIVDVTAMRSRLELQSPVEAPDAYGQPTKTWVTLRSCWAQLSMITGQEQVNAGQMKATATHQVMTRYTGDVDPSMRLIYNGRVFNILVVNNIDELNLQYQIMATEVQQPVTTP